MYIERDEFGFPLHLWLVKSGGYNIVRHLLTIVYLSDHDYVTLNVPREDVLHFPPSAIRTASGGIPTSIRHRDTTEPHPAPAIAGDGCKGRTCELIIGEEKPATAGTICRLNKDQMNAYAEELKEDVLRPRHPAIRGLDKVQNISMNAQEMQMFEQMGANDDVAVLRRSSVCSTQTRINAIRTPRWFHTRTILPEGQQGRYPKL